MAKTVVIDELHLTCRIRNDLPDVAAEVIRRTLLGRNFMTRLRRGVRAVLREFPDLGPARATLSR